MINATEQAIEVTGEVIASFTRLRERTKEMERRYETIPPNQPRKAVFKLMLDDSKQRLGIQQEKVILLCYRWGDGRQPDSGAHRGNRSRGYRSDR